MSTACALQYDELQMLESLTNDFHTRDQALLALIASSWNLSSARSLLQYNLSVAVQVNPSPAHQPAFQARIDPPSAEGRRFCKKLFKYVEKQEAQREKAQRQRNQKKRSHEATPRPSEEVEGDRRAAPARAPTMRASDSETGDSTSVHRMRGMHGRNSRRFA